MTENQRDHFYMPRFAKCAKANDWRMQNRRLVAIREENEKRSDFHAIIWQAAQLIADDARRAIIPEDFRYAVNAHVNRGKTSSKAIKENWRVNWAVACFDLLKNPDDVKAMIAYLNPQLSERAGTIAYMLELADESAWEGLSLNAFQTRDWKNRTDQQLDWMIKAKKNPELLKKKPVVEDTNRLLEPRFETAGVPADKIPW